MHKKGDEHIHLLKNYIYEVKRMKYFDGLTEKENRKIFMIEPKDIDRNGDKELLSYALGATLYMPVTREKIADEIIDRKNKHLKAIVLCLEDSIGDKEVEKAESMLCNHLKKIYEAVENQRVQYNNLPFIFVRVRNYKQLPRIYELCNQSLNIITGFALPKFSYHNGEQYFNEIENISRQLDKRMYGMPILETKDIIHWETRRESFKKINEILERYHELVLNIRIGATDFSSIFGIRRGFDITIYDIHVIRDCITDIVNNFGRMDREYVISGPVWEYFSSGDRIMKPQLRSTPFRQVYGNDGMRVRSQLLDKYLDGLIYEVLLDKANGLTGKTVIHPSHILPVQSLYVVSHEEYIDALSILENSNGDIGVMKSSYSNKMNEIKPHLNWAKKILKRSEIYGVFNHNQEFINLL